MVKKKRKEKHSLPTVFTQFRMQVKIFYEKYGLGRPRLKLGRVSFHKLPHFRERGLLPPKPPNFDNTSSYLLPKTIHMKETLTF